MDTPQNLFRLTHRIFSYYLNVGGAGKSKSVGGAKVRAGFEGKTNAGFLNKNGGGVEARVGVGGREARGSDEGGLRETWRSLTPRLDNSALLNTIILPSAYSFFLPHG